MFRRDVEAAGILYRDSNNEVADFHALRHTFVTNLAKAGVHPKIAQALARHSTIALTMDRYTHMAIADQAEALKVLPNLGAGANGIGIPSDGQDVSAECLAHCDRKQEISVDSDGLKEGEHLESQKPSNPENSACNQASGSVCAAGAGPGLQNQWAA